MRIETQFGSKTYYGAEGAAIRLEASRALVQRQEAQLSSLRRRIERVDNLPPHRRSVERAMLAVEEKFVKAMWVLQRSTGDTRPIGFEGSNGISYTHDDVDQYGQAVANGGWIIPEPRPAIPQGKEIDEALKVQGWLSYLSPREARILTIGAMSKRGDAGEKVKWMRVRARLPELTDTPERTLRHTYTSALRNIVAALTMEKISHPEK